uniref:Cupin type-1 domain-containing protein n=1 Tax=Florenciella sp. virus SA2 TaxID=3240092 RepID=A0AB39J6T4_9VIRU
MLLELFILCIFLLLYFLVYVDIKINKNNEFYNFDDTGELTRQNLNNEILLKMPFYFDADHINREFSKEDLILLEKDKKNKYKKYKKIGNSFDLFTPNIKSEMIDIMYILSKGGSVPIHTNDESITYYFVRNGDADVVLIHPKFKDNFDIKKENDIKYLWNNSSFKKMHCKKGTVVYVPNGWLVSFVNNKDQKCNIEKLSYSTIINKLILYFKKVFNYNSKN